MSKQKFTIQVEAYYLVTFPDGSQEIMLLEIGKKYQYTNGTKLTAVSANNGLDDKE